jgi:hypothetical protein
MRKGEESTTNMHEKYAQAAFALIFNTFKGENGRTNVC